MCNENDSNTVRVDPHLRHRLSSLRAATTTARLLLLAVLALPVLLVSAVRPKPAAPQPKASVFGRKTAAAQGKAVCLSLTEQRVA